MIKNWRIMGKHKKGFNWKARQQQNVIVRDAPVVAIEASAPAAFFAKDKSAGSDTGAPESVSDSNALVLPSTKRTTIKKNATVPKEKFVSRRQKKMQERLREKRIKSAKRGDLIQAIQAVQATETEMKQFMSITQMQTKGLKRHHQEERRRNKPEKKPKVEEEVEALEEIEDETDSSTDEEEVSFPPVVNVFSSSVLSFLPDPEPKSQKEPSSRSTVRDDSEVREPLSVSVAAPNPFRRLTNISLSRVPEIQEQRSKLPITGEEQFIMEKINSEDVVVICGETGSGKTTQVPQFLYEAGYASGKGIIGVTEPRRVAAISMANRVGFELKRPNEVSYQIRYEGNISKATKIKFMTDGVLMRELASDFLLQRYSVIVIDEAHERSVYTDVLIGLLSRIVPLRTKRENICSYFFKEETAGALPDFRICAWAFRSAKATLRLIADRTDEHFCSVEVDMESNSGKTINVCIRPFIQRNVFHASRKHSLERLVVGSASRVALRGLPLKLIIMSATLRIEDFTLNSQLFPVPPAVIKVESRQYPVTIHFNRRTPSENEYLQETFKKVCKIHRELPAGGILIFVTGQQEVNALCKRLRQTFPQKPPAATAASTAPDAAEQGTQPQKLADRAEGVAETRKIRGEEPSFKLDMYSALPLDEEEGKVEMDDESDGEDVDLLNELSSSPMFILPLYSLLPSDRQACVFQPAPPGCRLCVVATNVAETSLTIPDVKYVVDSGKTKMKLYDKNTGLSTFRVMWTSKASANQRAGRAGRTSAGHCYRMYSSAVFNDDFPQFTPPEITRRPIEDLVLQMKAMNIDKTVNFPFPTPPSREALLLAEQDLLVLGAVEKVKKGKTDEVVSHITELGKTMSGFPVAPKFAKMLALSGQNNLMPYVITLIAALSVQEPILDGKLEEEEESSEENSQRRCFLSQLKKRWVGTGFSKMLGDVMVLLKAVGAVEFSGLTQEFCNQHCLRYKAMREIRQLRQQLTNAVNLALPELNCSVDPTMPPPSELQCKMILQIILCCMGRKIARKVPATEVAAADPAEKVKLRHAYRTLNLESVVYIHPFSVLCQDDPEYILYQELFEGNKIYCRNVVQLDAAWIGKFAPQECVFSLPLESPEPRYDEKSGKVLCHRSSTFGPYAWPLPAVEADFPAGTELHRWFGRFFLEGRVCPRLNKFTPHLLIKPAVMVKSWSDLQPKTQSFLRSLMEESVGSRSALLGVWSRKPDYLLAEYLQWLPVAYQPEVQAMWPPS